MTLRPILLAAFLLAAPPASGDPVTGSPDADPVARVERSFATLHALSARFVQTVESKGFGEAERSAGRVILAKPRLMRWDYDDGRVLAADPDGILWWYDPASATATRSPLTELLSDRSPLLFLVGETPLRELFDAQLVPGPEKDKIEEMRIRLVPRRATPSVKAMLLTADADGRFRSLLMVDHLGNRNRIELDDVTRTDRIDLARFRFVPPDGTAVASPAILSVTEP